MSVIPRGKWRKDIVKRKQQQKKKEKDQIINIKGVMTWIFLILICSVRVNYNVYKGVFFWGGGGGGVAHTHTQTNIYIYI